MRKKLIICIIILLLFFQMKIVFAAEENEILNSQIEELKINKLIEDIEEVTDENIDLNDVFQKSVKGESSGNILIKAIELILGEQLKATFKIMISVLLVIIIYGILKNISQNLGNDQTGKIGYFIQIIILITLLLKIYADILQIVRQTIDSISNFIYMLLPLFMSLSVATRKYNIINRN